EDRDRPARRAVLAGRRRLAALRAGLQPVDRSLGWHDRAHGTRRRDRRLHAAFPGPRLRRARACGAHVYGAGSRGGDRARRGEARAAEDDDRRRGVHGTAADHVVGGRRGGRDEAHRGADGGRAVHVVRARAARLPGALRHLEVALRDATRRTGSARWDEGVAGAQRAIAMIDVPGAPRSGRRIRSLENGREDGHPPKNPSLTASPSTKQGMAWLLPLLAVAAPVACSDGSPFPWSGPRGSNLTKYVLALTSLPLLATGSASPGANEQPRNRSYLRRR